MSGSVDKIEDTERRIRVKDYQLIDIRDQIKKEKDNLSDLRHRIDDLHFKDVLSDAEKKEKEVLEKRIEELEVSIAGDKEERNQMVKEIDILRKELDNLNLGKGAPSNANGIGNDTEENLLSMHHVFLSFLKETGDQNSVGECFTTAAKTILEFFNRVTKLDYENSNEKIETISSSEFATKEGNYSSHISCIFGSMLNGTYVIPIHQYSVCPSGNTTTVADIGLVVYNRDDMLPKKCIGIVEVKLGIPRKTDPFFQLVAYWKQTRYEQYSKEVAPVMMGIIIDNDKIEVYGAIVGMVRDNNEDKEKLYYVKLAGSYIGDINSTARLLKALVSALKRLVEDTQSPNPLYPRMPIKVACTLEEVEDFGPNVLRRGNKIIKIYDYSGRKVTFKRKSNYKLIKEVLGDDYLPGIKVSDPYEDITLLCYDYIDGDHIPSSVKQLAKICDDLRKLHKAKIVHGDIRFVNMLFCKRGEDLDKKAYLIDYDYAGKEEGDWYPETYNFKDIKERDPRAKPVLLGGRVKLKTEHDVYSMRYIVNEFVEVGDFDIKNCTLKQLHKFLNNDEKVLKLKTDFDGIPNDTWTGSPPPPERQ